MEDGVKNRLILILVILTLIFFMGTVSSCTSAYCQKKAKEKEMLTRIELEEKMNMFVQEKAALEEKINKLAKDLELEKAMYEEAQKTLLAKEQEIEKLVKLKDALEEDLKEALVDCKSKKTKKK